MCCCEWVCNVYLIGEALYYIYNTPSLTRIICLHLILWVHLQPASVECQKPLVSSRSAVQHPHNHHISFHLAAWTAGQTPLILAVATCHRFKMTRVNPPCLSANLLFVDIALLLELIFVGNGVLWVDLPCFFRCSVFHISHD